MTKGIIYKINGKRWAKKISQILIKHLTYFILILRNGVVKTVP